MRARAKVMARTWGSHQRSTSRTKCARAGTLALAAGLSVGCSGTPEKVMHPEPAPSAAAASTTPGAPLRNPQPSPPPATSPAPSPASPAAPSAYVPALACDVRGAPIVAKGANLWAEPQGATAVASFAGQPVNL